MACSSGKFEFCESGAEETVQLIYRFQRQIVHLRFENAGLSFYGFEKKSSFKYGLADGSFKYGLLEIRNCY